MLAPHPEPGKRGVFENGDVRIETDDGRVIEERKNARAAFGGRRNIWWDDLDLLYFGGYALWGYVVAPFIFTRPGFEVEEIEPWRERGEEWPGLRVRWPETLPAHSREQLYYFGPDGLIRRNDYTAEVFGRWAKATHYCWDYRDFAGIQDPDAQGRDASRSRRAARCERSGSCGSRSTTCASSEDGPRSSRFSRLSENRLFVRVDRIPEADPPVHALGGRDRDAQTAVARRDTSAPG